MKRLENNPVVKSSTAWTHDSTEKTLSAEMRVPYEKCNANRVFFNRPDGQPFSSADSLQKPYLVK